MMRQKLSAKLLVTFLIALILSISLSPAYACSPSPEAFNYTLADRVNNAPIILVGTVVRGFSREWGGGSVITEAEIEVEQYLKGEGPAIITISGFGDGADCRSWVQLDMRMVFFASGDTDGELRAEYLGVHDATWNADALSIQEITDITNHSVKPYPLPFTLQVLRFVMQYGIWLISGVMLFFCALAVFFVLNMRSDKRKTKAKRD